MVEMTGHTGTATGTGTGTGTVTGQGELTVTVRGELCVAVDFLSNPVPGKPVPVVIPPIIYVELDQMVQFANDG